MKVRRDETSKSIERQRSLKIEQQKRKYKAQEVKNILELNCEYDLVQFL